MKYCVHCGAEIHDEAVVCVKCGCSVEQPVPTPAKQDGESDTLDTVIKVFLIIGCITQGWMLLPLVWYQVSVCCAEMKRHNMDINKVTPIS